MIIKTLHKKIEPKKYKYKKMILEKLPIKDNYPIVDSKSRTKKTKI
jgi:hypothetical protein|tara:strand:+ start:910 stop:1047 length:138 start_codon:yes stop_codon:yes gene_type:complete